MNADLTNASSHSRTSDLNPEMDAGRDVRGAPVAWALTGFLILTACVGASAPERAPDVRLLSIDGSGKTFEVGIFGHDVALSRAADLVGFDVRVLALLPGEGLALVELLADTAAVGPPGGPRRSTIIYRAPSRAQHQRGRSSGFSSGPKDG